MEHQPTLNGHKLIWPREEIVSRAREFLLRGGSAARRELVLTTIELERLLREVP